MARPRSIYQVEGGRQLRKSLKDAGDDLNDLKEVHKRAAQIAANAAASRAPHRTGKLAGSVRAAGTKTAGIVRVGKKAVPYAKPIEYGWPSRNIKAASFARDAARSTEPRWIKLYTDELDRILNQIKGA
ncbi:HK97 gp10 family phage protein [Mycetocola reblochoni]|uniref:HK97 gp10 family phage protein n=1 Tax=Mycetocola reblochoni TaxID=331618 RepID=UPI003F9D9DFF